MSTSKFFNTKNDDHVNFLALIDIMPHKELLDPQGKTLTKNMVNLNINDVSDIRVGKHIEMRLQADNLSTAEAKVEKACKDLLANVIMESYRYEIKTID